MSKVQGTNAGVEGTYLPRQQKIPVPRVQASANAKAKGRKRQVAREVILLEDLAHCRTKLERQKAQITKLWTALADLRSKLAEERPDLAIRPVRFLKHAARYVRTAGDHDAANILFAISRQIAAWQSLVHFLTSPIASPEKP